MTRLPYAVAITATFVLMVAGQVCAQPGPPGISVQDRPGDQGGVLQVTITASADDGGGADSVVQYDVERRESGGTWAPLTTIPATDQPQYSFDDTGLTNGTQYDYRATAFDGTLASSPAEASGVPADDVRPRPARRFTVTDHANDHGQALDLRFVRSLDDGDGANDVIEYRVVWKAAGGSFAELVTIPATGANAYRHVHRGLAAGTLYIYRVKAYDGTRYSALVEARNRPLDNLPPAPPRRLTVRDVANDNGGAVTVRFRNSRHDGGGPDDVRSYRVDRKKAGGTFAFLRTIDATDATAYRFVDRGLDNNTLYTYKVRAYDGKFYSDPAVVGGRALDNTPPRPPTNFKVVVAPNVLGGADISFDASRDDVAGHREVTRYEIFRKLGSADWPTTPQRTVVATAAAAYTVRDTGLSVGKRYWYRMRASAPTGKSTFTSMRSIIARDMRVPRRPRNLTASDRPDDDGQAVVLRWSRSADDWSGGFVARYVVFRRLTSVFDTPVTRVRTVTATGAASYTIVDTSSALMNLRSYTYWVKAANVSGVQSPSSNEATAVPQDNIILAAPTNFVAQDRAGDSGGVIQLQWNRSASEGGIGPPPPPPFSLNSQDTAQATGLYDVFRRRVGLAWPTTPRLTVSTSVTGDPIVTVDTGVPNGVAFEYKVRYRVDTAVSPFSNTSRATADGSSSASSLAAGLSVEIAEAPDSAGVGESICVRVGVQGEGLSQVRLHWMPAGGETWQKTAAATGNDSYEASFTVAPAGVEPGAEVRLMAVAEDADEQAKSEEVSVRIVD